MKLFPLHLVPNDTRIDFMRLRWISISIAVIMAVVAIGAIAFKGFNFALDFTGGTVVELRFQKAPDVDAVRSRLEAAGYGSAQVQTFGTGSDLLVRLQPREEGAAAPDAAEATDQTAQEVVRLASSDGNTATVMRSEFVGPQVGKELALNGLYTLLFVVAGFLIYIAARFEWKFAVAAIVTTLHDVLICAGFFALTGREFDLTILAGLLSVMGFSINDTIVVFDRVRENFRSLRVEPLEVLNRSINQTLSRTIITAVLFFLSALALYLYGGASMEGLAETHMVGAVIVVVSSVIVAVPMLSIGPFAVSKQDLLPKARDEEELARRP